MNEVLEKAARAVAEASGFRFKGESMVRLARSNPRAREIARAVLGVLGAPEAKAAPATGEGIHAKRQV